MCEDVEVVGKRFNGGSDPSVYALLYMLDSGAANGIGYYKFSVFENYTTHLKFPLAFARGNLI